jgi:hypothetical protein
MNILPRVGSYSLLLTGLLLCICSAQSQDQSLPSETPTHVEPHTDSFDYV